METTNKSILRSDELNCPSCVNNIESHLNNMEGVREVTVHFSTGRIEVEHDVSQVSLQDLIDAVKETGYKVRVSQF